MNAATIEPPSVFDVVDMGDPSEAKRAERALRILRSNVLTQTVGTVSPDFQCSMEGTTGALHGFKIVVCHSCAHSIASACWMAVYLGKGYFVHVDARRVFNVATWRGEQLHGADQRRRFLRDLNDRFQSAYEFAAWCQREDMPSVNSELKQSPIEDPAPAKGHRA